MRDELSRAGASVSRATRTGTFTRTSDGTAMLLDQICVATITRARDPREESLITRTLNALSNLGIPVVLADAGSPAAFVDGLSRIPKLTLTPPDHPGLVGQVKASVRKARESGSAYILYLESDKELFVRGPMAPFLEPAIAQPDTGVILASRSRHSFDTFPAFQRRTESAFNTVASDVLGLEADYLYGPFLMEHSVAAHVEAVPADLGWGWRPFIFATTRRLGRRVCAIEGDYVCPSDQANEGDEDRLHRLRQLGQNIEGLARAVATTGR
jgi:hypothetical protein